MMRAHLRSAAARQTARRIGVALFAALSLFLLWFGATYASVRDMLWFHAAAVAPEARGDVRPLYFALMTLVGGASMALGLLGGCVVLGPLRAGAAWARRALAASFSVAFVLAAITAEKLAAATGSPTSWHIMGGLLAAVAVAYAAHAAGTVPGAGRTE